MKKVALILISPNIPVPPKGWGAIEKYIWEYKINLEQMGHQVELRYPDAPDLIDFDIVQVHTWNQALVLHQRNIPYIFSFDDTHAIYHGKTSNLFKGNLEAIQKSKLTIVHSEYLIDFFGEKNIVYLRHGANPDVFYGTSKQIDSHNLLCVGRTDQDDRKGLLLAIEVAKELDLPITIVGPNEEFFKKYPSNYDKLTLVGNTDDEGLNKLYNSHSIFLHPSKLETGHPNLTLVESLYCNTPVVGTCNVSLLGMEQIKPTKEDLTRGIKQVIENYTSYLEGCIHLQDTKKYDWYTITQELYSFYNKKDNMKEILIQEYSNTKKLNIPFIDQPTFFNLSFNGGCTLKIDGCDCKTFDVRFYNHNTNQIIYQTSIKGGQWAKPSAQYFIKWRVEVRENGKLSFIHVFDCSNKKVYIILNSKALGDTVAWFPYIEEFRKLHNCEIICSTFHNDWFEQTYPEITFLPPGDSVEDVYASYQIGWFYKDGKIDLNKNKVDPKSIPLQQAAADILGIPYKEIIPKLHINPQPKEIKEPYIIIAPHGSKHASYWNYPKGWQTVIDWLNKQNYKVVIPTREPLGDEWHDSKLGGTLTGVIDKTGCDLDTALSLIKGAKAVVGISSGLTWISWALKTPTILISGFSEPYTEMQGCTRVSASPNVCNGCFNTHKLDGGDWEWCPHHKNTPRHFECSKSITPSKVIDNLKETLNIY